MPEGPKIPVDGPKKATEAMIAALVSRGMSHEQAEKQVNLMIRKGTKEETR